MLLGAPVALPPCGSFPIHFFHFFSINVFVVISKTVCDIRSSYYFSSNKLLHFFVGITAGGIMEVSSCAGINFTKN